MMISLNKSIINDVSTGAGDDVIRDALPKDIVNTGAGSDTVYISYTTLDPETSLNINGGLGSSYFDWIVIDFTRYRKRFYPVPNSICQLRGF